MIGRRLPTEILELHEILARNLIIGNGVAQLGIAILKEIPAPKSEVFAESPSETSSCCPLFRAMRLKLCVQIR